MESFERYAGFFPDAAVAMMRHEGYRVGASDPIMPILPGGPWADAILPDVMGYPEHAQPTATEPVLTRLGHRFRAFLARS